MSQLTTTTKNRGVMLCILLTLTMSLFPASAQDPTQPPKPPIDWTFVDSTPPPPPYWCFIPGTLIPYPCSWTQ